MKNYDIKNYDIVRTVCSICLDSGKIYCGDNQYEKCECMIFKKEEKPINLDFFDQLDKDI